MESSTDVGDSLFSRNSLGAYTIKCACVSLAVVKRENLRLTLELLARGLSYVIKPV